MICPCENYSDLCLISPCVAVLIDMVGKDKDINLIYPETTVDYIIEACQFEQKNDKIKTRFTM